MWDVNNYGALKLLIAYTQVLKQSRFQVWFSAHQITEGLGLWAEDGIHIHPIALKHQLQVKLIFAFILSGWWSYSFFLLLWFAIPSDRCC